MSQDPYSNQHLVFVTDNNNDWHYDFYFVQNNDNTLTPLFISEDAKYMANNANLVEKIVAQLPRCVGGANCSIRLNYTKPDERVPTFVNLTITKFAPLTSERARFYNQLEEHKEYQEEENRENEISGGRPRRLRKSRRHSKNRKHSRKTKTRRRRSNRRK
jgi:hypothetical protein